jgi:hypothetical protein
MNVGSLAEFTSTVVYSSQGHIVVQVVVMSVDIVSGERHKTNVLTYIFRWVNFCCFVWLLTALTSADLCCASILSDFAGRRWVSSRTPVRCPSAPLLCPTRQMAATPPVVSMGYMQAMAIAAPQAARWRTASPRYVRGD